MTPDGGAWGEQSGRKVAAAVGGSLLAGGWRIGSQRLADKALLWLLFAGVGRAYALTALVLVQLVADTIASDIHSTAAH